MEAERRRMRGEMGAMAVALREGEERAALLEAECARAAGGKPREAYTRVILERTAGLGEQRAAAMGVVGEIRAVQRAINAAAERLTRAEALADERIFRAAQASNREGARVGAYRRLQDLKGAFERLMDATSGIGRAEADARDLEAAKAELTARLGTYQHERIAGDLAAVREENARLRARLRR